jgi:hypothetical protein
MEGMPSRPEGHADHPLQRYQDPARMRISDQDRHRVAEVLRHAAGEGRLELEELDDRLDATFKAKTYADLVPLTSDLPVPADLPGAAVDGGRPAPEPSAVPAPRYTGSVAVLGDTTRRGVWRVPTQHSAFSLMGGVNLDLREAVFEAREVTINAVAIMAGVDISVNAWTQVLVEGVGIMGDFSQSRDRVPPELTTDSPVVRVTGFALMGGVSVKRKRMPGDSRRRRRS